LNLTVQTPSLAKFFVVDEAPRVRRFFLILQMSNIRSLELPKRYRILLQPNEVLTRHPPDR
jgi:hypothetical protein